MTKKEHSAYARGERAAWQSVLSRCINNLGMKDRTVGNLVAEREAAVAALRSICEKYGDNDWLETHHLADVIEKHLERHLDSK